MKMCIDPSLSLPKSWSLDSFSRLSQGLPQGSIESRTLPTSPKPPEILRSRGAHRLHRDCTQALHALLKLAFYALWLHTSCTRKHRRKGQNFRMHWFGDLRKKSSQRKSSNRVKTRKSQNPGIHRV